MKNTENATGGKTISSWVDAEIAQQIQNDAKGEDRTESYVIAKILTAHYRKGKKSVQKIVQKGRAA